jgi:hypothetical protein
VPAFLVKSSQKRHLSGRIFSQVADADSNQAHGDSLYVRALQALLGRGEDRRRIVGRLGEMRLTARDLEVGALESPHATPRPPPSMGPRQSRPGILAQMPASTIKGKLQWGRDNLVAEFPIHVVLQLDHIHASMGRDNLVAEFP